MTTATTGPRLYGLAEVSEAANVPYWRLYYWLRTGKLQVPRFGGAWCFSEADLRRVRGLAAELAAEAGGEE